MDARTDTYTTRLGGDEGVVSSSYLAVPEKVMATFGPRKRVPVVVTIRGVSYRSTTCVFSGESFIPVRREIRAKAGLEVGQHVRVTLVRDEALRAAKLLEAFEATSFSHKREHVQWIEQAKRPETRARGIATFVEVFGAKTGEPARR